MIISRGMIDWAFYPKNNKIKRSQINSDISFLGVSAIMVVEVESVSFYGCKLNARFTFIFNIKTFI